MAFKQDAQMFDLPTIELEMNAMSMPVPSATTGMVRATSGCFLANTSPPTTPHARWIAPMMITDHSIVNRHMSDES